MLIYYKNQYLFSEIYLDEITNLEEDRSLISTLETISETALYADKSNLKAWNESFVHELLRTLKFKVDPVSDNIAILKQYGNDEALTICYSLLPEKDLDTTSMGSNYSFEIISALKKHNLKWGILTNGNQWRIYHIDEPTPYENYLEIDLESILNQQDKRAFQLIFFFLKAENFIKDGEGNSKFDLFKKESQDKIAYIEDELKNALKQKEEGGQDILSNICYGYIQYLRNEGTEDFSDESLRVEIYGGSLLYMFRLLFLFYARARDLMTEDDSKSFDELVNKAKQYQIYGNANSSSKELWVQLRIIFGEIDRVYNGGLFNRDENNYTRFIENATISDTLLSAVIYNMSHYEEKDGTIKPISYRDMNVRHLGTLYEGLLEHKLFVAQEDIEVKVTKKEIQFIPESQGGKIIEGQYIPKGKVYFGNDKGLRKATGSYYTPEYIVEYIVTNTVDEKLNELKDKFDKQVEPLIQDLDVAVSDKEKKQIGLLVKNQLLEFTENEILALSVLDPAMGSGHFLVNATSHIANFITGFLNCYEIVSDIETNTKYWSRKVVENCIYGVDLNVLATELAKLSLWILTMAKNKPLSFLNHHLKIGNSLIGAKLSALGKYPFSKKEQKQKDLFTQDPDFKSIVQQVIDDYSHIRRENSDSKNNIETKKEYLDEIDTFLKPYKDLCDLHTSIYFGNDIDEDNYYKITNNRLHLQYNNEERYFHWELEFPEILIKKNGFQCIIGNPPWGASLSLTEKKFLKEHLSSVDSSTPNSYIYFIGLSQKLSSNFIALLIPDSFLMKDFEITRTLCKNNTKSIRWFQNSSMPVHFKHFPEVDHDILTFIYDNKFTPYLRYELIVYDTVKRKLIVQSHNKSKDDIIIPNYSNVYNLILNDLDINLRNRLISYPTIGDIAQIHEGIHSGNCRSKLFIKNKRTGNEKPLFIGGKFGDKISSYYSERSGWFVDYRKEIIDKESGQYASLGDETIFIFPKIYITRTGNPFICFLDESNYASNNFFSLQFKKLEKNSIRSLSILSLILNSQFAQYYLRKHIAPRIGTTFVETKIFHLLKIPLPLNFEKFYDISLNIVKRIIERKRNGQHKIDDIEQEINTLIIEMYQLNSQEIETIGF